MPPISTEEHDRYTRQMMLPEIGVDGQEKLKAARVLIAGLGGLGSVSAFYLAAAGVGRLKIVDCDCVAIENLNRQILHQTTDIGVGKTDSAAAKLKALNPHCQIEVIASAIRSETVDGMADSCDLIVDAVDNVATRILLNRASVERGIPFLYGGIDGFTGMVSTFLPGITPCFECLFPGAAERSGPNPVVGPVPAVIGALQSLEALKYLLGMDGLLTSRLLYFDGRRMQFREIQAARRPDCTVCGTIANGNEP